MTDSDKANETVKASWNVNAQFWDNHMGEEGNSLQRLLIDPATKRLLNLQPGEEVLEIACGNGRFSRIMAGAGARVLATDFAASMIEIAQSRDTTYQGQIDYKVLDATDQNALLTLGEKRFDVAVCSMAMFDMAEVEPLVAALSKLLKDNGRFVFSLMHPCFNTAYTKRGHEVWEDLDGIPHNEHFIKVLAYSTPLISKGSAIRGQPELQLYFHRTISTYFNLCFQAGFVLDGMEEPAYSDVDGKDYTDDADRDIPPVLVARMRLVG